MIREAPPRGVHSPTRIVRGGALALTMICASLFGVTGQAAPQDKSTQPPPAPAANGSSSTPDAGTKTDQDNKFPLRKALKEKKVLTEDDLRPKPKVAAEGEEGEPDFNPVCDPDCEEIVRSQTGVEPDHELEFRNKLKVESLAIGRDQQWNNYLYDATRTAAAYCDWKRKNPQPSSQQGIKAILDGRDLWWKYKDKEGWVLKRIQDVQQSEAFRAVVMRSEWQAAYYRCCQDLQVP